jgi:SAM-dependent methyltransferase
MEASPICECCGSSRWRFYARKNGYQIWRCRTCGTGEVQPALRVRDAAQFYDREYYEGSSDIPGYCEYEADRPLRLATARSRLRRITRRFLTTGQARVLDIGCGFGEFLEPVDSSWLRFGVEVSPFAAESAARLAGVQVAVGSADALPLNGPFDLVTLWDVLEHLPGAGRCLREIRRILAPDGLLVFSTPDFSSSLARLMGRSWYLLAPPTHLKFFSRQGLRCLLKANGFTPLRIESEGKYVSVRLMRHLAQQFDRPSLARLADLMLSWSPAPSFYVNLFDQVTVYAKLAADGPKDDLHRRA